MLFFWINAMLGGFTFPWCSYIRMLMIFFFREQEGQCHTRFSEGNQVQTYMHARIKFHAYSDIKVYTETVSRMKKKDYQTFTLYPGNEGSKHHMQSTGGCVRLAPATTSQVFKAASSFWATLFIARVSTCRTQQVWKKRMNAKAL
jgi:hypothetical protein